MEVDADATEKNISFVIKATDVPHDFFENRDVAKRYFRRFGKVKLVMFKPKRNALLVEYANEDSMLNALEVAGEFNGQFFNVIRDTQIITKKKKGKKNADPDWTDDPDVRSELEAMGAFGAPRAYDLRSEAMNVDAPESSKAKQRRWKGAAGSPKPLKKKSGKELISNEQYELTQIVKQPAFTVEDKFKILDARDKLIRIKLKGTIELSKAKATVGTCPDMCPEKERLMRETQHQVALYEQEEGGKAMNAKLAVKQYSRSSADQEAPLPQELRPVGVLQMTMGYLMHRIMRLCETADVNIAEWYHFLWDRTRGIRKDITQQELCCQGSVELVEQCARFHIFCSARLVAEDPSVFDQKINTENLTKCLQTLKYMYHDLLLKGETCKNEPEFRAYIILLNLNDGNFMWEVQHLPQTIQQSKEVKFALAVYSSLDKQNYVKFFKLVNSTTFLNACILMRYFTQVRITALKTLLKSYSPRISQTSLPIQHLTKILGFEGPESTIDFCESYGLFTNVERSRVILDKLNFAPPEYPYILDRAINLVESKRDLSVGEVVCGRDLPPKLYESHAPQDSFDKDGYLKHALDFDEVDNKDEPMKTVETIEVVERKVEPPRPPPVVFVPIKPVERKEQVEKPRLVVPTTPSQVFAPIKVVPPRVSTPTTSIFAPPTQKVIFGDKAPVTSLWSQPTIFGNVATTTKTIFGGEVKKADEERLEEARKKAERAREEERRRLEHEKEEAEKRRVEEERRVAEMRKKLIEEQQKRREQERRKNVEIKAAVCNVVSDLLDAVEESMKEEKLAEIARRIYDRKVKSVIAKWRENTRRRRKRKALDFEPVWFGTRSVKQEAEELRMSGQNLALQSMKRYKRGKALEIQVSEEEEVAKIDLCELTYKLLRKRFLETEMKLHRELFWKVVVSLPHEIEFGCGLNHVEKILNGYLKWEKRGSTTVVIEQSKSLPTITYCLEKQKGLIVSTRNDTNGFVFIADDFNDDLRKRIVQNFKTYGVFVKIPIVLVLQTYSEDKSNLKSLISEGVISDYLILVDKFTSKNLINSIEEALIFLSTRTEKSPPLELDTFKSFLTKHLCNNLWKRANSFSKWNSNYKACLKNPNTVIYLHNEALTRLKRILLDEKRHEYAKFPEIFKDLLRSQIPDSLPCDYKYFPTFWEHSTYVSHMEAILDGLKLPNFLENWPPKDPLHLEISISKYCATVVPDAQKCFYRTMSVLLRDVDPNVNFKDVGNVIWTEVVELLALEKLEQTDFSLYGTGFVNKSVYNQLVAVYDVQLLNEYVRSDWFYVNNPVVKQKVLQMLESEKEREGEGETGEREEVDLDVIFAKVQQPQDMDVSKIKGDFSSCKKMLSDLEDSVVIHRKILEKSRHFLKTIIEES